MRAEAGWNQINQIVLFRGSRFSNSYFVLPPTTRPMTSALWSGNQMIYIRPAKFRT